MNIGIDLDNTIFDTGKYLINKIYEWNEFNGLDTIKQKEYKNVYEMFGYDNNQKLKFDQIYVPIMHVECKVIDNAKEIINKLKNENNKIYIITYRGSFQYENYLEVTKKWLEKNNILYDELITERWDKGEVCKEKNIDILIDDEPVHLKQASDLGVNTLLFRSLFNNYCNEYNSVNSWEEVYDVINQIKEEKIK